MWDVIADALLDTLKLLPFLLLLYILIELMEHNTRVGRANRALAGGWAPLLGSATGLIPMCGFSVMAAKLYEKRYVTLGTLLAVFIATSDEAFLVMLVSDMSWLNKLVSILSMCGIKLALGAAVGYAADLLVRRAPVTPMPVIDYEEEEHGHDHDHEHDHGHDHACEEEEHEQDEFTACEHKHGRRGNLSVYFVSPLLHTLQVAAFVLLVNLAFGFLFYFIGEDTVIEFLQGSGYWYQPLICSLLGFVPNCASSVILAEVYAMGGSPSAAALRDLSSTRGSGISSSSGTSRHGSARSPSAPFSSRSALPSAMQSMLFRSRFRPSLCEV